MARKTKCIFENNILINAKIKKRFYKIFFFFFIRKNTNKKINNKKPFINFLNNQFLQKVAFDKAYDFYEKSQFDLDYSQANNVD